MKRTVLFILCCSILCAFSAAQKKEATSPPERVMQTFAVFLGERKIGSDLVIRVGWLQGVDLLTFADGIKVVRMDLVYDEGQFRLFKFARDNKEELTVRARRDSFALSHVTKGSSSLRRRGDEVVLEPDGWGQYAFLLKKYDAVRGGIQSFWALVPSQSKVIMVSVERLGGDRFQCGNLVVQAVRHRVMLENKDPVLLWTTQEGKLIGIHHASRGICTVDEQYENLHHNIRALALGGL